MGRRGRPAYPLEIRSKAVYLALYTDKPTAQIANDLGVSAASVRNWVRQSDFLIAGEGEGLAKGEEVYKLHLEVERLREENNFLRRAAVYFAQAAGQTVKRLTRTRR